MKYVNSGNGKMPLISLLAILSISLCINMPGLAVSPIMGKLHHLFNSTVLESQLLTSLPNLVMFPVVLLAGKMATPRWQTAVLTTGLAIFLAAGVASLFADSMELLIFLGCMVGVGCGLVVPIAAGAISEWFVRKPRQMDLGLKSSTSNSMVIIANVFCGMIVAVNWHAAFAVYLVPIIPLALVPFMTVKYIKSHRILASNPTASATDTKHGQLDNPDDDDTAEDGSKAYHFQGKESLRLLIAIIALYLILTYATSVISYYAPFMMDEYGMNTTQVGLVTAAYYFTIAVSGAIVAWIKKFLGKFTMFICLAVCATGLIIMGFTHSYGVLMASSLFIGLAYGVIQPVIYNKTTYIAPTRKAGTTYFGYVLSSNYVAIMMVPFVDSFFRKIFHSGSPGFEFVFSGCVVILLLAWAIVERKNYVFSISADSAAPSPVQVAAAEAAEQVLDQKENATAATTGSATGTTSSATTINTSDTTTGSATNSSSGGGTAQ